MTDEQLAEASQQIQDLREEVREDIATEIGGDPEEYRADTRFDDGDNRSGEAVPDGGESDQE